MTIEKDAFRNLMTEAEGANAIKVLSMMAPFCDALQNAEVDAPEVIALALDDIALKCSSRNGRIRSLGMYAMIGYLHTRNHF